MSLGNMQRKFVLMVGLLIFYAYFRGYELTFGDAFRDPRVFGELNEREGYGRPNSNHKRRLAIDFNLFKGGEYLTKTDDHLKLGEFWEFIGGTWGGRFDDGNHYSLEYQGYK